MIKDKIKIIQHPNINKIIHRQFSYGESIANSLILYSIFDRKFLGKLKERVINLPDKINKKRLTNIREESAILLPLNYKAALRRTDWLISKINHHSNPETALASTILKNWSREQTLVDPKQLIVGIIQVAIPGITLGKFNDKFPMTVIIRKDLAGDPDLNISHQISKASLGVLAKALDLASGNAKKLEPEIADWFFDAKKLLFYSAEENELTNIVLELHSHGITHTAIRDNENISVLAISPAVNRVYQSKFWKIEPLEN